jgi:hypothetical protein
MPRATESACSLTVAYPGYGCWASDQAAFLVKYYVLGWSQGLLKNAWYWWGQADVNNPWGILYCLHANTSLGCPADNTLQAAGTAFGVA